MMIVDLWSFFMSEKKTANQFFKSENSYFGKYVFFIWILKIFQGKKIEKKKIPPQNKTLLVNEERLFYGCLKSPI